MKLAHYVDGQMVRMGVVGGDKIFSLSSKETIDKALAADALKAVALEVEKVLKSSGGKPLGSVKLCSPILSPGKIIMVANNYPAHSKEENIQPPNEVYLFARYNNSLIGPGDSILAPKASIKVDWEVELAVIIGKVGKYISRKEALDHVAGYAVSNDVSFRDLQSPVLAPGQPLIFGPNWIRGKTLDSSFPLGPWLVTRDEIPEPQDLEISLSVNGQTKQHSNTSEMLFRIDEIIEYASNGITLQPGDIISTGTPSGVAAATGQAFLKHGDVVEGEIERIGTLTNQVVSEA